MPIQLVATVTADGGAVRDALRAVRAQHARRWRRKGGLCGLQPGQATLSGLVLGIDPEHANQAIPFPRWIAHDGRQPQPRRDTAWVGLDRLVEESLPRRTLPSLERLSGSAQGLLLIHIDLSCSGSPPLNDTTESGAVNCPCARSRLTISCHSHVVAQCGDSLPSTASGLRAAEIGSLGQGALRQPCATGVSAGPGTSETPNISTSTHTVPPPRMSLRRASGAGYRHTSERAPTERQLDKGTEGAYDP